MGRLLEGLLVVLAMNACRGCGGHIGVSGAAMEVGLGAQRQHSNPFQVTHATIGRMDLNQPGSFTLRIREPGR